MERLDKNNDYRGTSALINLSMKNKDWNKALFYAEKCIKLEYEFLGLNLISMNNLSKEELDIATINLSDANYRLATIYRELESEKYEYQLKKCIKLNLVRSIEKLANFYYNLGDYRKCYSILEYGLYRQVNGSLTTFRHFVASDQSILDFVNSLAKSFNGNIYNKEDIQLALVYFYVSRLDFTNEMIDKYFEKNMINKDILWILNQMHPFTNVRINSYCDFVKEIDNLVFI